MLTNAPWKRSSRLAIWIGVGGVLIGTAVGVLVGINAIYLGLAVGAVAVLIYFFNSIEQASLGLLILRSSLDVFSAQQVPAAFAVGLDALTLLYVTVMLLTGQRVRTDGFWWCFACWLMLQGLWVILLPLGGLGLSAAYLPDSIREWVRLFSWLMVYLLVMQLKDQLPPEKVISTLFFALVLPIAVALMQVLLPSILPAFLSAGGGDGTSHAGAGESRVRGTLGLANTFATFLFLFLGLTWWKLGQSKRRWPWLLLLGLLAFFFVGTKSLFSLMMLGTFVLVLIAPKLSLLNLIGGVILFAVVVWLFGSTDFGQQRLGSISHTPLLNPDIDVWRAILLSQGDDNSFNWRLSQWYLELQAWQQYPLLGYGLGLSIPAVSNGFLPHNDYIRALVEGGIVGFVTFLSFFGAQVVHLVRLIRSARPGGAQHQLCLTLLAVLLAIPVGMLTENIWSHTTLFFYWWTVFGVAGWDWHEQQMNETE